MDEFHSLSEDYEEGSDFPASGLCRELIEAAAELARRCAAQPGIRPFELVGLGRALYALDRLPKATPGVCVHFEVSAPPKSDNDSGGNYWQVDIADNVLSIDSGGYTYDPHVGSDSFTTFEYQVETSGFAGIDGQPEDWIAGMRFAFSFGADINVHDDSENLYVSGQYED